MKLKGFATPEGTERFKNRFASCPGHFRLKEGVWFSSIGAGSYLGEPDEETDREYREGLKEAIRLGVNVVDSAINYRCQRSERSFGAVIRELIEAKEIRRDEMILCTKGGYLPFDGDYPPDPHGYFKRTYVESELLEPTDIAQGCHAMTPAYLEDQLNRSLENFGVETIDIYYLHNPETQLAEVSRKEFMRRLGEAFGFLEKKVSEGKIRWIGLATWSGFRTSLGNPEHLALEEIMVLAREAGGVNHHLKVVQLPLNLAMPEAWVLQNQNYGANLYPFLDVAQKLGVLVVASASLLQGQLTEPFPPSFQTLFGNLKKPSQGSLQFVRSCPGVVTALAGMKQKGHVRENLETAKVPPLTGAELTALFQQT